MSRKPPPRKYKDVITHSMMDKHSVVMKQDEIVLPQGWFEDRIIDFKTGFKL